MPCTSHSQVHLGACGMDAPDTCQQAKFYTYLTSELNLPEQLMPSPATCKPWYASELSRLNTQNPAMPACVCGAVWDVGLAWAGRESLHFVRLRIEVGRA
jgi:hypothetical protein